jgi:hypothetical protein
MTCQHIRTHKVTYYDCTATNCLDCPVKWREFPIRMTDEEYDSCLLLLAAYLLGRDLPDDHTLA